MDARLFLSTCLLLHVIFHDYASAGISSQFWKIKACNLPCRFGESERNPKSVCSCSESCVLYGDCCAATPWNNFNLAKGNLFCLAVDGFGGVSVVDTCPNSGTEASSECKLGFNSGLPATSRRTRASYSNVACAHCNNDADSLDIWSVNLKCTEDNSPRVAPNTTRFIFQHKKKIFSMALLEDGTNDFTECKFILQEGEGASMEKLELRGCQRKEISTCSPSWTEEAVRKACAAYLDPIYSHGRMYRNKFCAICNDERDDQLTCIPETETNSISA